jgi:VIT1/CCC1 family predicted Fe2+/Mn2+ transporter
MPDETQDHVFSSRNVDTARIDSGSFFKSVLEPMERISEILFGLVMLLTFTGSLEVATAGQVGAPSMLLGALGCSLAWGIIDGCVYLIARLHERGRRLLVLRTVRDASNLGLAQELIAEALPLLIASLLQREQLELLRDKLQQLPEPPTHVLPQRSDWIGAVAVCVLMFVSAVPVLIPFIFIANVTFALRTSNAIAVTMMFLLGYAFGHYAGFRPSRAGFLMVLIGLTLVALSIALSG